MSARTSFPSRHLLRSRGTSSVVQDRRRVVPRPLPVRTRPSFSGHPSSQGVGIAAGGACAGDLPPFMARLVTPLQVGQIQAAHSLARTPLSSSNPHHPSMGASPPPLCGEALAPRGGVARRHHGVESSTGRHPPHGGISCDRRALHGRGVNL